MQWKGHELPDVLLTRRAPLVCMGSAEHLTLTHPSEAPMGEPEPGGTKMGDLRDWSQTVGMWHRGMGSVGMGGWAGAGLGDLSGLFHPSWFCDLMKA